MSPVIDALRQSQNRFTSVVSPLSDTAVRDRSYDDEWSIADVASHLGSQAEIFGLFLDAGIDGTEPPNHDAFLAIWDRWNAKPPTEQVSDSVAANESLVARIEEIPTDDRGAFAVEMFGGTRDLDGLAAMRLSEHAVHTWDIAVALDPERRCPRRPSSSSRTRSRRPRAVPPRPLRAPRRWSSPPRTRPARTA